LIRQIPAAAYFFAKNPQNNVKIGKNSPKTDKNT
jgi:hypothetical protein